MFIPTNEMFILTIDIGRSMLFDAISQSSVLYCVQTAQTTVGGVEPEVMVMSR